MTDATEANRQAAAARRIQRVFRGHRTRVDFHELITQGGRLDPRAVDRVLGQVQAWHRGWTRLGVELVLAIALLATLYVQMFAFTPTGFEASSAMDDVWERDDVVEALDEVREAPDLVTYLTVVSQVLQKDAASRFVLPNSSKPCMDVLHAWCSFQRVLSPAELQLMDQCTAPDMDSGYVDTANLIRTGLWVIQRRKKVVPCLSHVKRYDPFETRKAPARQCYTPSWASGEEEHATFTSPFCAAHADTCEHNPAFQHLGGLGFVTVIPVGMLVPDDVISCRIQALSDMLWFDEATMSVELALPFYNSQGDGLVGIVRQMFVFPNGGGVEVTQNFATVSTFPPASTQAAQGMTIASLVMWVGVLCVELAFLREGDVPRVQGRACGCALLTRLLAGVMSVVTMGIYLSVQSEVVDLEIQFSWADLRVTFNNLYVQLTEVTQLWHAYTIVAALSILLTLARLLACFDFHVSLATVSQTLRRALGPLGTWAVVFAVVTVFYAVAGVVLLGNSYKNFTTLGKAIQELLLVTVGQGDYVRDEILYAGYVSEPPSDSVIHSLYFWSYVFVSSLLLLNVLLAILVDAFVRLQDDRRQGAAFFGLRRSFAVSVGFWARGAAACLSDRGGKKRRSPYDELLELRRDVTMKRYEDTHSVMIRARLTRVFVSSTSVEICINRMRALTQKVVVANMTKSSVGSGGGGVHDENKRDDLATRVLYLVEKMERDAKLRLRSRNSTATVPSLSGSAASLGVGVKRLESGGSS